MPLRSHSGAEARIFRAWLKTPEWRALSPLALKYFILTLARHRPNHEPALAHSRTQLARMLHCSPATAASVARELVALGLHKLERAGGLSGHPQCRSRAVSLATHPATTFLAPTCSRTPYAAVPEAWLNLPAWQHLRGPAVKLLLDCMARHNKGGANLWTLTNEVIAARTGCSLNTATGAAAQIVRLGWMRHETVRGARIVGANRRILSLSQFPTDAGPAEPWRYERWLPPVVRHSSKTGRTRIKNRANL